MVFWRLGRQATLLAWMWGEESGGIKDDGQVSDLNNEWTVMTMTQGRLGERGGRGEEYKSGSLQRRLRDPSWTCDV